MPLSIKQRKQWLTRSLLTLALLTAAYFVFQKPFTSWLFTGEAGVITSAARRLVAYLKPAPPTVTLTLNDQAYQSLLKQRDQALAGGILLDDFTQFVPATFKTTSGDIKAEIRLKGILPGHWQDESKMSFKLRLTDRGNILGMRQFSLMHPKARDYIYEWLFIKALKREGILAPRVEFVTLNLNGTDRGVFVLEEDIGAVLIENNHQREGPIVSFSKKIMINQWAESPYKSLSHLVTIDTPEMFNQAPLEIDFVPKDQEALAQRAKNLLQVLRSQEKTAAEIVDVDKMATLAALRALFASAEFDPNDVKFYLNPITGKLEPIGAELSLSQQTGSWWLGEGSPRQDPFIQLFFSDPEFANLYHQKLVEVTSHKYLDNFLEEIRDDLNQKLASIYREFPQSGFNLKLLQTNRDYLRKNLSKLKQTPPATPIPQEPFLKLDLSNQTISFLPGQWIISRNLIIPPGYTLIAPPGTQLKLQGASLISYSPLKFLGTQAQPIVIASPNGTGGLLVLNTKSPSELVQVIFENLSSPRLEGRLLTGAVTFYQSEVNFLHCLFLGTLAEDALNLIGSQFTFRDCQIKDVAADALDVDFSSGTITSSEFARTGNDGVDISSSEIQLDNLSFKTIGDKAISIGENSQVTAQGLNISQANLGLAIKDASQLTGSDITIKASDIGIAVFEKKSQFGSAQATLTDINLKNLNTDYIVEIDSSLTIDGELVPADYQKVRDLLYDTQ